MFKNWLKQVAVVLISLIIVVSPLVPSFTVRADDYKKSDTDNDSGSTYYIVDGQSVDNLFNFTISDVENLFDWIWSFKTFTVIKEMPDGTYKCYFNTPNLQQFAKNQVAQLVPDGYTDNTYDVNQTQWLVDVGAGDNGTTLTENAITKYGFNIPSYTYLGEYPKETLSVAGIIPSPSVGVFGFLWRGISAMFGGSFLKAPTADNYNTIRYLNHTYTDGSDYVVTFFNKYYLKYFCKEIAEDSVNGGAYFTDPDNFREETVTQDANDAADLYCQQHKTEYGLYMYYKGNMEIFNTNYDEGFYPTFYGQEPDVALHYNNWDGMSDYSLGWFGLLQVDCMGMFLMNNQEYQADLNTWLNENEDNRKIMFIANAAYWGEVNSSAWTTLGWTDPSSIEIPENPLEQGHSALTAKSEIEQLEIMVVGLNDGGLWTDMPSDKIISNLYCTYTKMDGTVVENATWTSYRDYYNEQKRLYNEQYLPEWNYLHTLYKDWCQRHTNWASQADPEECGQHSNYEEHWIAKNYDVWDGPVHHGVPASWLNKWYLEPENVAKPPNPEDVLTKPEDMMVWGKDQPTVTLKYQSIIDGFINNTTVNLHTRDLSKSRTMDTVEDGENEFLTNSQKEVIDTYEESQATMAAYQAFLEKFNRGTDDASDGKCAEIYYRQCLIENKGNDNECWSDKYGGEKTWLSVANVYVYSGVYDITKEYLSGGSKSGQSLSVEDTYKVLKKIQSYCGPYYDEVIQNMIKLMIACASDEGDSAPANMMHKDDPRIMPYDTKSLTQADAANYAVPDPRSEIWRNHLLGNYVASFALSGNIGIYFKFQPTIIGWAGKITEISVFLQQLCNFDIWDSWGLSPANLWSDVWVTIVMGFLALFFIVKTVLVILKNGSQGGYRVVLAFLLLIFELGMMTYVSSNPQGAWNQFKQIESKIVNLGEEATLGSDPELSYLFNGEPAVAYYIPYLDTWSLYNTGYGIKADQQQINTSSSLPELKDVNYPKIGTTNVKQYSVMLADSFSYYGDSDSVIHSVLTASGENVNGTQINNNAYRVVDHFLAPRVSITKPSSDKVHLEVTENENYNGEFQSGILDLLLKLLLCCLYCFLSIIKFLTFVWFWWMLYLFFFRTVINKVEKKKFSAVLLETITPLFAMVLIGIYVGIIFTLTSELSGLFGMVFVLFLFYLTFVLIRYWKKLGSGTMVLFPATLEPIYFITNFKQMQRNRNHDRALQEANRNAADAGVEYTEDEQNDYEAKTRRLFKADGSIADEFSNGQGGIDKKYEKLYLDYYKQGERRRKEFGIEATALQKMAQDKIRALDASTGNEDFHKALVNADKQVNGSIKHPFTQAEPEYEEPTPLEQAEQEFEAENSKKKEPEDTPKTQINKNNSGGKIKADSEPNMHRFDSVGNDKIGKE